MDCLKGYIGISPAVGIVASNLYLTELPGITLNNLDKIAEQQPEQADYNAVFTDCEKRAIISFVAAFTAKINECYQICEPDTIECLICENIGKLGAALWYAIGAEYAIERQGSDRLNRFTTIDKKKAAEMQQFFEARYEYELSNAVKSINPNNSDCIDSYIDHKQFITFIETRM